MIWKVAFFRNSNPLDLNVRARFETERIVSLNTRSSVSGFQPGGTRTAGIPLNSMRGKSERSLNYSTSRRGRSYYIKVGGLRQDFKDRIKILGPQTK